MRTLNLAMRILSLQQACEDVGGEEEGVDGGEGGEVEKG